MDNLTNCKSSIVSLLGEILQEIEPIKTQYIKLFSIENLFTSDNAGKIRLNRQVFNNLHEEMSPKFQKINSILDESLDIVRNSIRDILNQNNEFYKVDLEEFIFDDIDFLEIIQMDLTTHGISKNSKELILQDIKKLLKYKNRIFNYKYLLSMFDTVTLDKSLNKFHIEDLVKSEIIFDVIDSYSLQFEELKKFEEELKYFENRNQKIKSFNCLNSFLNLHKKRAENFNYANIRYKIYMDWDMDLYFKKELTINLCYIENIISSLVEQSYMDLIKKELKKGKMQKSIDFSIKQKKNIFEFNVKNNGFEIKNIYNLFLSDVNNKYILEAKNLANEINATLNIVSNENDGVIYSLVWKL